MNPVHGWSLIGLAEVPATPWRNGGGLTRELLAWPTSEDWDWRISVAEVASSGPFSRFDGVQRRLAILDGAGVRLVFADRTIELGDRDPPLAFAGADAVQCELLDGPVRDLNLMVRGEAACLMQRVDGSLRLDISAPGFVAVYAQASPALVRANGEALLIPTDTLAWRCVTADVDFEVEGMEAILIRIQSGDQ